MDQILQSINRLFESEMRTAEIARRSGVHENTVRRLRKGYQPVEDAKFKHVIAIYTVSLEIENYSQWNWTSNRQP